MIPPAAQAWLRLALLLLCTTILSACQPPEQQPIYTGPTLGLDELVTRINARNAQIPSFWARQDFDGQIADDKGNMHSVSARGVILYRAPDELRLVAENEFGPIFDLGANSQYYWLKIIPQMDTLWWGRMENIGKASSHRLPLRPDLLLDVLGVGPIPTDYLHTPYPVLRFNNDADAYMIDTIVPGPDRMVVRKEVWYDRQTLLPGLVLLFDDNGRVVLRAFLQDYQPLAIDDVSPNQQPLIATTYKLKFPDTGSTMQFVLSQQALTHNGVPRPGSIHRPDLRHPGVGHVIDVDAGN